MNPDIHSRVFLEQAIANAPTPWTLMQWNQFFERAIWIDIRLRACIARLKRRRRSYFRPSAVLRRLVGR